MSRPRLDLQTTYGKLTVISDLGGLHTLVRCECGDQKWVLRTNLRAGRIRSCGKPGCRTYATAPTRSVVQNGPSWLPVDAIPGLYARAQQPGEVGHLAKELQVSDTSIYNLLREIRDHGGIETYMAFLSSTAAPAPEAPTLPTIKPGEVHAPPKHYTPGR